MLLIHVEALNARNADLRRAADRDRRRRAPRFAHPAPAPESPRRRARQSIRATTAAVVTRAPR